MYSEKNKLACRKKVRTYSKRLVTTLSTISFIGYIAALVLNIPVLSLYFSIACTILSVLSSTLNIWSLADHFRQRDLNKQLGVENTPGQEKLTKICLDITSNVLFLIGGITPILPFESPIIPFVSTAFFILGCAFMATNIVRTRISEPQAKKPTDDHSLTAKAA
ncbi:hypothetical protein wCauA_00160 [Wolbachia endosymbiont of Carposina sasakii]|uniref:hypothetical protein n=1 Tax=Wolbachia TaxID=953 RepID=UPI0002D24D40|nr:MULTISPECIES: hypothetical protein [Wolbachia]AGK00256.1 hypothetical protein wHa_08330 [Wolbachia endosymbiont of Drosophila simulans wHa]MBS9530686.1 hypothetical protein [Wolbachia endosymbiont of Rhagoletis cerasi]QDH18144.1 hypothetical protein wCauA_00160 [Wolbachia endosymbiont of Carposina sasakii]